MSDVAHGPLVIFIFFVQSGQFSEDMIPTVGFNMRKITKGNVTIKVSYLSRYSYTFMVKHVTPFL